MLDVSLIFDGTFSTTAPITPAGAAITADRVSTNVIDFLVQRDMGAGGILECHVMVMANFATCTSLDIEYQVSADNATFVTVMSELAIPVAQLVVGTSIFRYKVPLNQYANATAGVLAKPGRYHRLNYTVNGSDATAGSVFAFVNSMNDRQEYYTSPANYTTR